MSKFKGEQRLIEMRAVDNEEGKTVIEGYAVTYDQPVTHIHGARKFTEIIKCGALDLIDISDVLLRCNHNNTWYIAVRARNNSLLLVKDEKGLKVIAELINTQSSRDIYKSIREELIGKVSFVFTASSGGDIRIYGDEETPRTITNIKKLYDVNVVDTPFYDTTSVFARSFESLGSNLKQLGGLDLRKRKLELGYRYKSN